MKLAVLKGATSQILYVFIRDSSATTGVGLTGLAFDTGSLVASYVRPAAARSAITLATQTTTGAFSSGGFVEVDATNMPGIYRLDVPDAVFATGVDSAVVMLKGAANMEPVVIEFQLTGVNLQDAVRAGLTALPNAAAEAAGGLYTRGSGAGQINQANNGQVDVNVIRVGGTTQTAGDIMADTNDIQTRLPAALVSGRMDVSVGAMAANVITAAATAPDFTTEVTAAVATSTALAAVQTDVDDIQARLPAALTGGRLDVSVGAMQADVLTAAATASDFGTEVGTAVWATTARVLTANTNLNDLSAAGVRAAVGLASANLDTQLTAIDDFIDTEVAAIKAKTDQLVFTVANQVDVNVLDWKSATAPAMTGDAFARLGAPAGASISADIATVAGYVDTEVAAIFSRIGAPVGASISADIAAVKTDTAAVKVSTDKLDDTVELTSDAVYVFSRDALANAPSGSGGGGSPTAVEIANEVQTRTIAAVTVVNGLAANVITAAATAADFTTEVTAALATSAALTAVAGDVTAVKAKTDNLPTDPADQSLIIAATDAVMARVGAPVGASISADIAAVAAKTTNLPSDPADASVVAGLIAAVEAKVDIVDANVDAVLLDTGTDGVVVAAGSKTGYRLSATGVDDVLDEAVDGATTLRESVRLANAALAGKASGLDTTEATFRDLADTKDRIVATVDANGNRTAVTRDLS